MASNISAVGAKDVASALFTKLDTQKKGYIDGADLKAAAGEGADDSQIAAVLAQLDENGDGRVVKSELSVAIEKVGNELSAQLDESRVNGASAGARPAGPPPGGGGGAPKSGEGESDTESDIKYIAAADADGDGTVSEAEDAAYKKALAAAEAKAQSQANEYTEIATEQSSQAGAVDVEV